MKNLLILAALLVGATLSQAGVPGGGGQCSGKTAKQSGCQPVEATTTQECGGQEGRTQSKQKGKAKKKQAKEGKGGCQGKSGKGNGKGKGQQQGKGKSKGKGGQCGSKTFTELEKAAVTKSKVEMTPAVKKYVKVLQSTLEEELYARDYYLAADKALDGSRRFGNLANAEQHHADAVSSMITYLGGTPVMKHSTPVVIPADPAKADATCKEVELLVIKIYAGLIKDCPDPFLLPALEHIQASNYRHLSAVGG